MNIVRIDVKDFCTKVGWRYAHNSKNSGEEFFESYIKPKLEKEKEIDAIVIWLDGILFGYTSAFLDEGFWRLYLYLKERDLLYLWEEKTIESKEYYHLKDFIENVVETRGGKKKAPDNTKKEMPLLQKIANSSIFFSIL